ncbi:Leucine-rich repeat receptor protein kinase MSP1 [Vitis vinifera]|uniref:Leucine-rich repeat receptor protein kinase MSP1 n=1 Tax=Vitis vinifera TaxID=29760 RepID=A0A438FG47_VITVI|nr:Leucine-rich repeat receptor protein kinase MSP1 [Vitis vinifera]
MLRQKTVVVDKGKGKLVAVVESESADELLGKKIKGTASINFATFERSLLRMKPLDILSVTGNISKTYIIGDVGKVKRENLVPLLGCCILQGERFLAYECMENGSLDVWLRNRAVAVEALDWPTRFKICLGSARGLAFLRHDFFLHIIHRDINPSNIFLTVNLSHGWQSGWLGGVDGCKWEGR